MFDSEADRDMATLATTDLDIEALYVADPDAHPVDRGYTELDLLAACEQQVGFLHAMQFRALARFAAVRPSDKGNLFSEFAPDEVALALGWTRAVAGMRLSLALTLTDRLPATLAALERGEVDLRRVQKLAELTDPLPAAVARAVEAAVLPQAKEQNTSELARAARKAIARLDPDGAQARHEDRKQDRRVVLYPMDDAMAELRAYLPAADATRVYRKVDQAAHAATAPGDGRTMDQRRADALTDLILNPTANTSSTTTSTGSSTGGGGTSSIGGGSTGGGGSGTCGGGNGTCGGGSGTCGGGRNGVLVQVTMPATMLMGLTEHGAELAGYGPIPAPVARELAADGTWRRLLTDPVSGHLLDYGRTTYRPPAALADFIRARDRHCIFPGCMRAATTCDIDHRKPYPEGATSACNLACLCRHHHRLKHEAGWSLDKQGDRYVWTTPTGQRFESAPEPIAEPIAEPVPEPIPPAQSQPTIEPATDPPPF